MLYIWLQPCLLQEEADEERGAAPESAAEEEERLRREREAKAQKEMQVCWEQCMLARHSLDGLFA